MLETVGSSRGQAGRLPYGFRIPTTGDRNMRQFATGTIIGLSCLLGVLTAFVPSFEPAAQGQTDKSKSAKSASKKKTVVNTQSLDVKAGQIQSTFVKETEDLANQYFDAGHLEKAKALLESVLALNPQQPGIQQKIKKIDDTILTSNDVEVEVNPSHKWESTRVIVFQDRPVRIQAEGLYRIVLNNSVGPNGFPDKDLDNDLVSGIPVGALMGIVLVNNKPGKPFLIGDGRDYTPKETGVLFLRVNCPAENKNTGKVKVAISGYVKAS